MYPETDLGPRSGRWRRWIADARVIPRTNPNASGLRRTLSSVANGSATPMPTDVEPATGLPPLLVRMLDQQAATGLPPAYLPRTRRETVNKKILALYGLKWQEIGCRPGRSAATISRCGATQPPRRWAGVSRDDRPVACRAISPSETSSSRSMRPCALMWKEVGRHAASLRRRSTPGPAVSWNGRRHGQRQDRRWARAWKVA